MRALLYADAMNPEMSSEPGFVFQTVRSIVDNVDEAVVATQVRNREAIERVGIGKADIVYLDTEYIARPIWKLSSALRLNTANLTAVKYPVQVAFERALWKHFGNDLQAGRFDILHRVGPISATLPSPLAKWSSANFVIGPINGGLPYPPGFRDLMRREGEMIRHVRKLHRLLPYVGATYRNAAAILAGFEHTIRELPPGHTDRVFDFAEVGADPEMFHPRERSDTSDDRLVFFMAGRMVPFKCMDVAVKAVAQSPLLRSHRLVIAGDGPERTALESIVQQERLEDCVEFLGWTAKEEVANQMGQADAFVFPSIRDSGAGVIAEAMMSGVPSVVVNYGPGEHLIDNASGIRVPLGNRDDHISSFKMAMEKLVEDQALRKTMGQSAHERALSYLTWDARAKRIVEVYRWVNGIRTDRPLGLFENDLLTR